MSGLTTGTGLGATTALAAVLPNGTTRHIALFTALPTQAGTGGTEASGSSYARATCSSWAQNGGTPGRRQNNAAITFTALTGALDGIVGWGIYDAASGGNLLAFGPMRATSGGAAATKNFVSTNQPQFAVGEIWVEIRGTDA